jgi:hypothetical protein
MTATYPTDRPTGADTPNPLVRATLALERATVLDLLTRMVAPAARAVVASPRRRDLLQGRWLGHAVHPLLVMVPVGAWSSVTVLDLVGGPGARPAAQPSPALASWRPCPRRSPASRSGRTRTSGTGGPPPCTRSATPWAWAST